ncbi:MAG: hypothetical protein RL150_316 [Candidatus Parcubacteria bacterium]|jgi:hypothetical protein
MKATTILCNRRTWNTVLVIVGFFAVSMIAWNLTQPNPGLQLVVMTIIGLAGVKLAIDNGIKYDIAKPLRDRGIAPHPFLERKFQEWRRSQAAAPRHDPTPEDWGDTMEDDSDPSPFESVEDDEDDDDGFWDDFEGDEPRPWVKPTDQDPR